MLIKLPAKDYTTRFVDGDQVYIIESFEFPGDVIIKKDFKFLPIDLLWYWRNQIESQHNKVEITKSELIDGSFSDTIIFRGQKMNLHFYIKKTRIYYSARILLIC